MSSRKAYLLRKTREPGRCFSEVVIGDPFLHYPGLCRLV